MPDERKTVQISRLGRNILFVALALSLALNLFIIGATVNFYMSGHPDRSLHSQSNFKTIEKRVLRRLPESDRDQIRDIFKQRRADGRGLINTYQQTRIDMLEYLRSDTVNRALLTEKTMNMLDAERELSRHMNRIMIEMVMASSPEGREKIARMVWRYSDRLHGQPR